MYSDNAPHLKPLQRNSKLDATLPGPLPMKARVWLNARSETSWSVLDQISFGLVFRTSVGPVLHSITPWLSTCPRGLM